MAVQSLFHLFLTCTIKASALLIFSRIAIWFFAGQKPALRTLLLGHTLIALLVLPIASLTFPKMSLPFLNIDEIGVLPGGEFQDTPPVNISTLQYSPISITETREKLTNVAPFSYEMPTKESVRSWHMPAWYIVVLSIYGLGVGIVVFSVCVRLVRMHILRSKVNRFAGVELMGRLDYWCARLNIHTRVDIGISDLVTIPTVLGIFRPLIVMPARIVSKESEDCWDGVLIHELAHVKRRDAYWNVVGIVTKAIYWFHPGVLWFWKDLADTREYACDDLVVQILENPDSYATTLLEVTARSDRRLYQALGLDMARTSRVLDRVNRIINHKANVLTDVGCLVPYLVFMIFLASTGVLASIQTMPSNSASNQVSNVKEINTAKDAAQWIQQQYWMRDYPNGYRQGSQLLTQFPEAVEVQAWIALCFIEGKRIEDAEQIVQKLPSDNPWTHFTQAFICLAKSKQISEKSSLLKTALEYGNKALICTESERDVFDWLYARIIWEVQGQGQVLSYLDTEIQNSERPSELLALKGLVLGYSGENESQKREYKNQALSVLGKVLQSDSENISALYNIGILLSHVESPSSAYRYLKKAADLSPHSVPIHMRYWYTTLRLADRPYETLVDEVEKDIIRFTETRNQYPETLFAVASIYDHMEMHEKKYLIWNQLLTLFPKSIEATWIQTYKNRELRRHLKSESDSQRLRSIYLDKLWHVVRNPQDHPRRILSETYRDLFNFLKGDSTALESEIIEVVQGLVQFSDLHTAPWSFYEGPIVLAERTGNYSDAKKIIMQGLQSIQSSHQNNGVYLEGQLHDALGWILFLENDLKEAERELLQAYRLNTESGNTMYHLARLYERLDDLDQAESFYRECLGLQQMETRQIVEAGLERIYHKRYGRMDGFDHYLEQADHTESEKNKKRILTTVVESSKTLLPFKFVSVDGVVLSSESLLGKIVVLHADMNVMEPQLMQLQNINDHYKDDHNVQVIHVNLSSRIRVVANQLHLDYPVVIDNGMLKKMGISRFPTTIFIGQNGRVVFDVTGSAQDPKWLRDSIWRVDAMIKAQSILN